MMLLESGKRFDQLPPLPRETDGAPEKGFGDRCEFHGESVQQGCKGLPYQSAAICDRQGEQARINKMGRNHRKPPIQPKLPKHPNPNITLIHSLQISPGQTNLFGHVIGTRSQGNHFRNPIKPVGAIGRPLPAFDFTRWPFPPTFRCANAWCADAFVQTNAWQSAVLSL